MLKISQTIRKRALKRDKYKCIKCFNNNRLEVHHIDGQHFNHDLDNLATLCYWCHLIAPMETDKFNEWLVIGKSGIQDMFDGFMQHREMEK